MFRFFLSGHAVRTGRDIPEAVPEGGALLQLESPLRHKGIKKG